MASNNPLTKQLKDLTGTEAITLLEVMKFWDKYPTTKETVLEINEIV